MRGEREPTGLAGARLRGLVVDANDGIIATAGIVEGLIGAGARFSSILVAAVAAMIAGGLALGGAKYSEAATEHDAQRLLIEHERRLLEMSPEDELAELTALYEAKGLSPDLAREVAAELSEGNALAAHADAEYGISLDDLAARPLATALLAGVAFGVGSAVVLLIVVLVPTSWRGLSTFLAVVVSLCATSFVVARWGDVPAGRTVLRTVGVGVSAMTITLLVGSLFSL